MNDFSRRSSAPRTAASDKRRKMMLLVGGATGVLASLIAPPSLAQTANEENASDIVVTGTLIKGVAPVGASPVIVGKDLIEQTGAASSTNLLASIPLLGTFNTVAPTLTNLGNNTARPNLRGLSVGQFDPVTTLLMLDGHNMVGSGILQTSPDPTLLPTGAIERVEVVADGGSSLYGSDAVAGVINFITRKRFEGLLVESHASYADSYSSFDFGVTTGRNWDTGSLVVSAQTRQNTPLYAEDREFPRTDLSPFGGTDGRARTCDLATVQVTGPTRTYALTSPGGAFGPLNSVNLCDANIDGIIVPKEFQNSVFASATQELTSNIVFDINGYWSDRLAKRGERQISSNAVTVNNTNPFFRTINGETTQTISFSYAPVAGRRFQSQSESVAYGFTPSLTFTLPGEWEAKAMYNYGRSDVKLRVPFKNAAAEQRALLRVDLAQAPLTTANALNPYNIATTNRSVITEITNWATNAGNIQVMSQKRLTIGGPVFALPGGQVRVLVGAQHGYESIDAYNVNSPPGVETGALRKNVHKTIKSAFAELLIPIIGPENAFPLGRSLDLNLSGRYDEYSDFGVTRNPKIGFTYQPVEGVNIHGNIGTSFNAPSLADTSGAVDTRMQIASVTNSTDLNPNCTATVACNGVTSTPAIDVLRPSLASPGGNALLEPQTADTWAVGADFTPTFIPNLKFGITYWDAKLYHAIGTSTIARNILFATPAYSRFYIMYPTLQQVKDAFGGGNDLLPLEGGVSLDALYAGPPSTWPYIFRTIRRNNLGNQFVNGVDLNASYRHETSFGALTARINGTRIMQRQNQPFDGAPVVNLLTANVSRLSLQSSVGAEVGNFTTSVTVNYTGGYLATGVSIPDPVTRLASGLVQNVRVKSFKPVNLFAKYDFDAENGFANGLSATITVNNVFDINPPFLNSGGGTANGSTLGRMITAGVSKRF